MVDALNDAWRVLARGGTVLDLRPFAGRYALELVTAGDAVPIGWTDTTIRSEDDAAADAAVARAVGEGLFFPRSRVEFDIEMFWETVRDLEGFVAARKSTRVTPSYGEIERLLNEASASSSRPRLRTSRRVMLAAFNRGEMTSAFDL